MDFFFKGSLLSTMSDGLKVKRNPRKKCTLLRAPCERLLYSVIGFLTALAILHLDVGLDQSTKT